MGAFGSPAASGISGSRDPLGRGQLESGSFRDWWNGPTMPRLLLELGWLSGRPFGTRGGLWSRLGAHPSAPLVGAAVCCVFLVHKIQFLQFL